MRTLHWTRLALGASLCTAVPAAAQTPMAALVIVEHHGDRYGPRTRAATPEWQSPRAATLATGHLNSAWRAPTAVPPAHQAAASPRPGAFAATAAQLPPEILVDRHLVRVDRLLANDDYGTALAVMEEIVALQRQHELVLPEEFHFQHAQVAFAAGLTETAIAAVNEYLVTAGRDGDFYREALELLDTAEETLERADVEQRRVRAERQRAEARQRAHDELLQRQLAAAARPLPRDALRSGGVGPEMVTIASGRFQYQSRQYERRNNIEWVVFDRPLAVSKYEVTRGEFDTFVDRARYRTEARRDPGYGCRGVDTETRRRNSSLRWNRPGFDQTARHPVTCVSVRDAMAYARWLSQETGHSYRLPSAAEWQYAARAGSEEAQLYNASADRESRNSCGRANLDESDGGTNAIACRDGVRYTTDVGRFPPNRVGVHDMIGNVSELVLACGHPQQQNDIFFLYLTPDGAPEHPDGCGRYVVAMGAAWYHNGRANYFTWHQVYAQPSRDRVRGDWRYRRNSTTWTGFRVVRDLPEASQ